MKMDMVRPYCRGCRVHLSLIEDEDRNPPWRLVCSNIGQNHEGFFKLWRELDKAQRNLLLEMHDPVRE